MKIHEVMQVWNVTKNAIFRTINNYGSYLYIYKTGNEVKRFNPVHGEREIVELNGFICSADWEIVYLVDWKTAFDALLEGRRIRCFYGKRVQAIYLGTITTLSKDKLQKARWEIIRH